MDFKGIRTGLSQTLTSALDKVHGAVFSAPDLGDAAKRFTHAMQGETYTPSIGVEGEFDTNSQSGREYIADTRETLINAMQAYDKAYGHKDSMRSADEIVSSDYGIDVDGLIIDSQKVHAVTTATSDDLGADDVDHDELRV